MKLTNIHDNLIEEIIKHLSLNYNRFFNKIIQKHNVLIIENSKNHGSSIHEGRELLDIEEKLLSYKNDLDIDISLERIVLTLK